MKCETARRKRKIRSLISPCFIAQNKSEIESKYKFKSIKRRIVYFVGLLLLLCSHRRRRHHHHHHMHQRGWISHKVCARTPLLAHDIELLTLLRLLAINLSGSAASAVDLSALCTPLKIGLYLDNICEGRERKRTHEKTLCIISS
jgi:hypothetical protein